ncbi:MAG: oligopeptide/dipeptide ABC transporter ATP-binding protein [Chloroflexota bacterium]
MTTRLIELQNLRKYYPITRGLLARQAGWIRAVDGVSLYLDEGETLGLVGESGCGKSTLARTSLRLEEPTGGEIIYQGENITHRSKKELKTLRREAQMIFQDPQSSLDPRMTIGDSIGEAYLIHGSVSEAEIGGRVAYLLERVGLERDHAARYPHELSGGQKQRVGIARALAVNPRLIIADEPVSALDVSVQAQILNLLMDLQTELKLAYLFIAHDLAVIGHLSDRVAVMYLGEIVEIASRDELFRYSLHPYSQALLAAAPGSHGQEARRLIAGEVPSPASPPPGCHFHPRCPKSMPRCQEEAPKLKILSQEHQVACHLYE